jgi:Cys-tRNA(Pro) deacylase
MKDPMKRSDYPKTLAVRFLTEKQISFHPRLYPYEEHGGTRHAAESLGVPEHAVIKTLVMETNLRNPLLVLMHGDCEVSVKQLARTLSVKHVAPCQPAVAHKYTGYQVGGISPFGTRQALPVYVEASIFELDSIYINGGKRGFLVEINSHVLETILPVTKVEVAITEL